MAKTGSKKKEAIGPATINNRRATYDYHVVDTLETGIVLVGTEVKSIFLGRANLTDAYCEIKNGELWANQIDVEPYAFTTHFLPDRRRDRKLLAHKKQIATLLRKSQEKGFTLIPLKIYFKNRKAKVLIGLCEGKRMHDKRDAIAERDTKREQLRVARGHRDD
jgi:SsrA-binding protein